MNKAIFFLQFTTTFLKTEFETTNQYYPVFEFSTDEELAKQLEDFIYDTKRSESKIGERVTKISVIYRIS